MKPPVFDIDVAEFTADPYPFYQRMRKEAPICYVPQLDSILLTKRDDIFICEKNVPVFSSKQPDGLVTVLMGENMMRKDGDAHMVERKAIFPTVSPKTVANHWRAQFEVAADEILDELQNESEFNVVRDYAMRLSSESLKVVSGLTQASWQEMDHWSQSMIDGVANYLGDPEIQETCINATKAIDDAITEKMAVIDLETDKSLLGSLMTAGLPEDSIRANIKLSISGGQNEQRDAISGCVWALLSHNDQLDLVKTGTKNWQQVFDEYSRWIAPIGMSPRRINQPHSYNGVDFEPEQRVFLMFASANRDEECFLNPHGFDLTQDSSKSIAFGAGPHFCAGSWISKTLVSEVALPKLFSKFPNLKMSPQSDAKFKGWAFRGLQKLDVTQ